MVISHFKASVNSSKFLTIVLKIRESCEIYILRRLNIYSQMIIFALFKCNLWLKTLQSLATFSYFWWGSLEPIPAYLRVRLGLHPGKVIISSQGKHANFTQRDRESESNLAALTTAAPRRPFDSHCNIKAGNRKDLKERCAVNVQCPAYRQRVYCFLTAPHLSTCLLSWQGETTMLPHITLKAHWSVHNFANSVTLLLLFCYLCKMVKHKGDGKTWAGGILQQKKTMFFFFLQHCSNVHWLCASFAFCTLTCFFAPLSLGSFISSTTRSTR